MVNIVGEIVHPFDPDARIIPFGSYALQAQLSQSDIDVLVITTQTRCTFFDQLEQRLFDDERVSDIVVVRDTFVPVVKFYVGKAHYDIVVACVRTHTELECIEEVDRRAMSASFVTQSLLRAAHPNFASALVRIKTWAEQNHVYSNTLGLLNGIGLAILTTWLFEHGSQENIFHELIHMLAVFPFETYAVELFRTEHEPAAPGKCMTVYIPCESQRINAFHNVGPSQFVCIRNAARRTLEQTPERPIHFFLTDFSFFLHVHLFSSKNNHAPFLAQVHAKLKSLIKSLEPIRSHPLPRVWSFRSEHFHRSSMFIAFAEMPSLQTVSEFFVPFVQKDHRICTDILSTSKLPAFFYDITDGPPS